MGFWTVPYSIIRLLIVIALLELIIFLISSNSFSLIIDFPPLPLAMDKPSIPYLSKFLIQSLTVLLVVL